MKKKDMIFIIVLCVVIGVAYAIYQFMQGDKGDIEVYYHNEVIATIDISKDQTYTFEGDYGQFHLEVKDHQYHAVEVECPNHDCEKMGWIQEGSSKAIICVPNDIYVIQADVESRY